MSCRKSGSGRTIMTAEPKFVPENAVNIALGDGAELSVRLVDCVGYMVDGAAGQFEDGAERLVTTPWFDHEITMTEAAEKGTHKGHNRALDRRHRCDHRRDNMRHSAREI